MAKQSTDGGLTSFRRGRPPCQLAWAAHEIALMTRLWAEGVSAAAIARELGPGVSRCAVIGKLRRLGVPPRAAGRGHAQQRPPDARPAAPITTRRELARAFDALFAASGFACLARPLDANAVHADAGKAFGSPCMFMELGPTTCRWPLGDPGAADFVFCGAVPLEARPYCAAHELIARRPSPVARPPQGEHSRFCAVAATGRAA